MDSELMVYKIEWLKKVRVVASWLWSPWILCGDQWHSNLLCIRIQCMFPAHFMDCWSLYILDTDKKIFMVLDPTETHPTDEMQRKPGALVRRFQLWFCQCFNDIFDGWLVETNGWTFVYPLVAQHDPCTRWAHSQGQILHCGTNEMLLRWQCGHREESSVYMVHYIHEFNGAIPWVSTQSC